MAYLINHQAIAQSCLKEPLTLAQIKRYFPTGALVSKDIVKFKVFKKVWRCNEFSDCSSPDHSKMTLKFYEVLSSTTEEVTSIAFPVYGKAHFKVNLDGEVKLILKWSDLDIFAMPDFDLSTGKVKLKPNQYFRTAQGYINPALYASYFNETRKSLVSFKGHLGRNCFKLTSEMKVPGVGIMYDKYEITLWGMF